jgi:hypothetical protein
MTKIRLTVQTLANPTFVQTRNRIPKTTLFLLKRGGGVPFVITELSYTHIRVRTNQKVFFCLRFQTFATATLVNCLKMEEESSSETLVNIVACGPFSRQLPRNKQLYNDRYNVTAKQTRMFPRQQVPTTE